MHSSASPTGIAILALTIEDTSMINDWLKTSIMAGAA
jgi:hypothetical protein